MRDHWLLAFSERAPWTTYDQSRWEWFAHAIPMQQHICAADNNNVYKELKIALNIFLILLLRCIFILIDLPSSGTWSEAKQSKTKKNSTSPLPLPALPPTRCHWSKLMAWPFLPSNSEYIVVVWLYYIFSSAWLQAATCNCLKPKAFANCALPNKIQFIFIFLLFESDKIK